MQHLQAPAPVLFSCREAFTLDGQHTSVRVVPAAHEENQLLTYPVTHVQVLSEAANQHIASKKTWEPTTHLLPAISRICLSACLLMPVSRCSSRADTFILTFSSAGCSLTPLVGPNTTVCSQRSTLLAPTQQRKHTQTPINTATVLPAYAVRRPATQHDGNTSFDCTGTPILLKAASQNCGCRELSYSGR